MKAALVVIAAGAGAMAWRFLSARARRQDQQVLKSEIRKWEDEGGPPPQLPPVSPVVTPESSVPDDR